MTEEQRNLQMRSLAAENDRLRAERDKAVQEALDLMLENEKLHAKLCRQAA